MGEIVDSGGESATVALAPLLPVEPLERFLDRQALGSGPIDTLKCDGGHSNLTYIVRRGDASFVLRRPPRPPLPPSAHDVLREARVLCSLEGSGVPVPQVIATCDDESVLGVPFYLMEYLDGVIMSLATPPELANESSRKAIAGETVSALGALHAVDWRSRGLDGLGKPDGYLERQLRWLAGLWERARTRDMPALDEVTQWLEANIPDQQPPTIVHGDYRIGNLMFAPGPPVTLLGLLDWEMATLGDPLADLGYLTAHWAEPGTPGTVMSELQPMTREAGFPDSNELAIQYAELTGRSIARLSWYQVLALWKAAIFLEQSYRRFLSGNDLDPWFAEMADGVPELVAHARLKADLKP